MDDDKIFEQFFENICRSENDFTNLINFFRIAFQIDTQYFDSKNIVFISHEDNNDSIKIFRNITKSITMLLSSFLIHNALTPTTTNHCLDLQYQIFFKPSIFDIYRYIIPNNLIKYNFIFTTEIIEIKNLSFIENTKFIFMDNLFTKYNDNTTKYIINNIDKLKKFIINCDKTKKYIYQEKKEIMDNIDDLVININI